MKRFFGGLFMTVGFLIAGASGLCSLVVFVKSIGESGEGGMIFVILLFGGIPFFIGTSIFGAGKAMYKKSDLKEKNDA